MEATFKVNIDEKDILSQFEKQIKDKTFSSILYQTELLFQRPGIWNKKPGDMFVFIKDIVENKILSQDTKDKITKIIEREFDKVLEEATLKAMQHAANRMAFENMKDRIKANS